MHQPDPGREAFCRLKFAGIRALAPEAVAELNDGSMDQFHLEGRQILLVILEKLVIEMTESERHAFSRRVLVYRAWSMVELRAMADRATGLNVNGVDYETLRDIVEHAQAWASDTPAGIRTGYALAKRFLELACFYVERLPRLRLVVNNGEAEPHEVRPVPAEAKLRLVR